MFTYSTLVSGHGRLMDPPARNAMWRFGFPNPVNYNDNELFCGGYAGSIFFVLNQQQFFINNKFIFEIKLYFIYSLYIYACTVQWEQNDGKCGVCGDAYNAAPRKHEAGGEYAKGIISRYYTAGQVSGNRIHYLNSFFLSSFNFDYMMPIKPT